MQYQSHNNKSPRAIYYALRVTLTTHNQKSFNVSGTFLLSKGDLGEYYWILRKCQSIILTLISAILITLPRHRLTIFNSVAVKLQEMSFPPS